jgi:PEGA domain
MALLLVALEVVVFGFAFVAYLWVLRIAWRAGLGWFAVCLLVPLGNVVFAVLYPEARKPLLLSVGPVVLLGLGAAIVVPNYVKFKERSRLAVERAERAEHAERAERAEPAPGPEGGEPAAGAVPEDPPAIAATRCSVSSTPSGAEVLVDGKPRGRTPAVVQVWAGRNNLVTVRLAGYFDASETVNPNLNQDTDRHFTLRPSAQLTVRSTPPGARVLLGERVVLPRTPGEVLLEPGRVELVVHLEGRVDAARILEVEGGASAELEVTLPPASYVRVRSFPSGAAIFVDGQPTGQRSPAEVPVVAAQQHVLEVRQALYQPARQKVPPLTEGDHDTITIPMEAASRRTVQKRLAGARVELRAKEQARERLRARAEKARLEHDRGQPELAAKLGELDRAIGALRDDVDEAEEELATLTKGRAPSTEAR